MEETVDEATRTTTTGTDQIADRTAVLLARTTTSPLALLPGTMVSRPPPTVSSSSNCRQPDLDPPHLMEDRPHLSTIGSSKRRRSSSCSRRFRAEAAHPLPHLLLHPTTLAPTPTRPNLLLLSPAALPTKPPRHRTPLLLKPRTAATLLPRPAPTPTPSLPTRQRTPASLLPLFPSRATTAGLLLLGRTDCRLRLLRPTRRRTRLPGQPTLAT